MTTNKHGLPREIGKAKKRQIRQECGFGCVLCGRLPYHYDHFLPEYEDAHEHRPERIALLCGNHHTDKSARRIGNAEIARGRLAPFNRDRDRDATWDHRLGPGPVTFVFGGNTQRNGDRAGFVVNNVPIFTLERDEDEWLINGRLCDDEGRASLRFDGNEIVASRGQWDVTLEGKLFTVRRASREIVAQLSIDGERRIFELRRIRMRLAAGFLIEGDEKSLRLPGLSMSGNTTNFVSANLLEYNVPSLGTWEDWIASST